MNAQLSHPDAGELAKFFMWFELVSGFCPISWEAKIAADNLKAGKLIVVRQSGPLVTISAV